MWEVYALYDPNYMLPVRAKYMIFKQSTIKFFVLLMLLNSKTTYELQNNILLNSKTTFTKLQTTFY